jgi:O-antigen/teichoic acid export membrane protein
LSLSTKRKTIIFAFLQYAQLALTMAYGVFLLPVYIKYLNAEMYGAWLASGNIVSWLQIIIPDCGTVLMQRLGDAYARKDISRFSGLAVTGNLVTLTLGLVIALAAWPVSIHLGALLKLPGSIDAQKLGTAFVMTATGTGLVVYTQAYSSANLALLETLQYGIINLFASFVRILMILYGIFVAKQGVLALGIGNLIYGICLLLGHSGVYFKVCLHKKISVVSKPSSIQELASLFSLSTFARIGQTFARNIDYFLVARFFGPETITSIKLIKAVPEAILPLVRTTTYSIMPPLIQQISNGRIKSNKSLLLGFTGKLLMFCCFVLCGIMVLNKAFVGLWVPGSHYIPGCIPCLIIAGLVLASVSDVFRSYMIATGCIKEVSIVIGIVSSVQALSLFVMTYQFGLLGLASVPLCIYATSLALFIFRFKNELQFQWIDFKIVAVDSTAGIVLSILAGLSVVNLPADSWKGFFISALIYVSVFFALGIICSRDLRNLFRQVWQKIALVCIKI